MSQKQTHDIVISSAALTSGSALLAVGPFVLSMLGMNADSELRAKAAVGVVLLALVGTVLLGLGSERTTTVPATDSFSSHYALVSSAALAGVGTILAALASQNKDVSFPPAILGMDAAWIPVVLLLAAAVTSVVAAAELPKAQAKEDLKDSSYSPYDCPNRCKDAANQRDCLGECLANSSY